MSKCTCAFAAVTNFRKNSAAVIEPAVEPPIWLVSAIFESSCFAYGCHSGRRQTGSLTARPQRSMSAASASSSVKNGGSSGPSATRAAPVRVAKSTTRSGPSSSASARASPRTSRPSASVLPDFDRDALSARQDVPRAEGRARDCVLDRRHEHAKPQGQPSAHDHVGQSEGRGCSAHVLLHEEHGGRRLDVEAARVEGDALAHESHLRGIVATPDDVDEPRRGCGGAADRVNHRKVLPEQVVAHHARERGTVPLGEVPSRRLDSIRSQIVGGRVDEVTARRYGVGDPRHLVVVDAVRHNEPCRLRATLAVTVEAVRAEEPAQGRERGIRWSGLEPVHAVGEDGRELARQERIDVLRRRAFEPEDDAGNLAVRVGRTQWLPAFASNPCAAVKARADSGNFSATSAQLRSETSQIGREDPLSWARRGCMGVRGERKGKPG